MKQETSGATDTTKLARPVKAMANICAAIAAEAEKEESRADNDT